MMAHRLAAERADLVTAAVAVAGALDLTSLAPSRAVPVLQIHSVDDARALYAGGLGPPFPGTNNRVQHQPVMAGLERWARANGCEAKVTTAETRRGTAGTREATHTATLLVWRGCRDGSVVAHWRLTIAGHGWPDTTAIRAADEIWAFVSRFQR
jgi:polyhydroxybutyrate depolymerase